MVEHPPKEEILHLIREVENSPLISQRSLAGKLGISLGKTNYLLRELIKKGFIRAKNFSHSNVKSKINKIKYNLTKRGLKQKLELTYHFLKRKEAEYNHFKREWERLNSSTLPLSKEAK